jgi:preprotein translocase subunit SecG
MWLHTILTVVQVLCALAIIGLVLLQRGKGAEAGAGFGAGASGTVFGARGASTALSRATAIFAAIFMINSLALAYTGTRAAEQPKTGLLEEAAGAPAKPVPGATSTPVAPPAAAPTGTPGAATSAPANRAGVPATPAPATPAPTKPK